MNVFCCCYYLFTNECIAIRQAVESIIIQKTNFLWKKMLDLILFFGRQLPFHSNSFRFSFTWLNTNCKRQFTCGLREKRKKKLTTTHNEFPSNTLNGINFILPTFVFFSCDHCTFQTLCRQLIFENWIANVHSNNKPKEKKKEWRQWEEKPR